MNNKNDSGKKKDLSDEYISRLMKTISGAVSENGGKLVWFSSGSMLNSNVDYTVGGANSNLVLNALNWMGGQEETISIRAKSMDEATLTVPAASSSFWSAVMIGVIPAVLTAAGIIIYIRRKRR